MPAIEVGGTTVLFEGYGIEAAIASAAGTSATMARTSEKASDFFMAANLRLHCYRWHA